MLIHVKMKLPLMCYEYSIKVLKINLIFLIILHALKSLFIETHNLIENEFSKQTVITYVIDLSSSLTTNKSILVESIYKQHSENLRANHSELVTFINDMNLTNPTVISANYIDINHLFNLSFLKSLIKLTVFFDLNMACSLINIMLISYLINKNSKQIVDSFGSRFLYLHLCANLIILLAICLISVIYLVLRNFAEEDKNNQSSEKKRFLDIIFSYFSNNQLQESTVFSRYFFDVNKLSFFQSNSIHNFLSRAYLKFNVIIFSISTCLLASYSFLLHVDYESIRSNKNSYLRDNNPNSIQLLDGNEKKRTSSYETMAKFKKLAKKSSIQLQFISNLILVIFVLSIWDFSDVYYCFNTKALSPTFNIKNLNENNNILYNRLQAIKKMNTDTDKNLELKSFSFSRYSNANEETNFYKRFIYHRHTQALIQSQEKTNIIKQQYRAFTKIKILFYQNNNKSSQLFCNIFVIGFGSFLLVKLRSFSKLVILSSTITDSKKLRQLYSITI